MIFNTNDEAILAQAALIGLAKLYAQAHHQENLASWHMDPLY